MLVHEISPGTWVKFVEISTIFGNAYEGPLFVLSQESYPGRLVTQLVNQRLELLLCDSNGDSAPIQQKAMELIAQGIKPTPHLPFLKGGPSISFSVGNKKISSPFERAC